ncbi:hypothetical protein [Streptomyces sp. NPDC056707]|uniref:hypothetical protein n=1 Tax=Streptomyces sp. NPDC056707 TaxID=3345919 RepID=UPI0036CC3D2E
MRTRTTAAAVTGAALLLTLVSCSSESDDPKPATATAPAKASKPTPAPKPDQPLALGAAYTWAGESEGLAAKGTTTVLSYTQPAKGVTPPGEGLGVNNAEWAVVEIKVCNTKGSQITVNQDPWSLSFPDDTRTEATGLNGGDLPKPEYPTLPTVIKSGDCLRGKIPYPVEHGKRPDHVVYAPVNEPTPIEWAIPAK